MMMMIVCTLPMCSHAPDSVMQASYCCRVICGEEICRAKSVHRAAVLQRRGYLRLLGCNSREKAAREGACGPQQHAVQSRPRRDRGAGPCWCQQRRAGGGGPNSTHSRTLCCSDLVSKVFKCTVPGRQQSCLQPCGRPLAQRSPGGGCGSPYQLAPLHSRLWRRRTRRCAAPTRQQPAARPAPVAALGGGARPVMNAAGSWKLTARSTATRGCLE